MFYETTLLSRQSSGDLYRAWIAGTQGLRKMSKRNIAKFNIIECCNIMEIYIASQSSIPKNRFSLRLSAILLNGIIRIHYKIVTILIEQTFLFLQKVHMPIGLNIESNIFIHEDHPPAQEAGKRKRTHLPKDSSMRPNEVINLLAELPFRLQQIEIDDNFNIPEGSSQPEQHLEMIMDPSMIQNVNVEKQLIIGEVDKPKSPRFIFEIEEAPQSEIIKDSLRVQRISKGEEPMIIKETAMQKSPILVPEIVSPPRAQNEIETVTRMEPDKPKSPVLILQTSENVSAIIIPDIVVENNEQAGPSPANQLLAYNELLNTMKKTKRKSRSERELLKLLVLNLRPRKPYFLTTNRMDPEDPNENILPSYPMIEVSGSQSFSENIISESHMLSVPRISRTAENILSGLAIPVDRSSRVYLQPSNLQYLQVPSLEFGTKRPSQDADEFSAKRIRKMGLENTSFLEDQILTELHSELNEFTSPNLVDRHKKIVCNVANWDFTNVLTIEDLIDQPINRRKVAQTFNDLLTLSEAGYVKLVSEPDSLALQRIEKGIKFLRILE